MRIPKHVTSWYQPSFLPSLLPPSLHAFICDCACKQKEFIGNHVLHVSKDAHQERKAGYVVIFQPPNLPPNPSHLN